MSGIKGVGKRSFVNAITGNKRTKNNVPVFDFKDDKTGKEITLCFIVNNIAAKGAHIIGNSHENKPRREDEAKSIQAYSFGEIPPHEGVDIFMYDITNEKSFIFLKEQINKNIYKNKRFAYLIGNKVDDENRRVEHEDAKKFAIENDMLFTEVSADTKKNLSLANKFLKHRVLAMLSQNKTEPPQLPPRDADLDGIDESLYSGSKASDYERNLVK